MTQFSGKMAAKNLMQKLSKKYDVPAPRYTSYPTVPYWENAPSSAQWLEHLRMALRATPGSDTATWALYMHIPYCESLCTFCGCTVAITKDHSKEDAYVDAVLREWKLYTEAVPALLTQPLQEIHLGGGTPTFLSPQNLTRLLHPIIAAAHVDRANVDFGIEVDPRRTTEAHLVALRALHFNRISLGVQDFDPEVQRIVHRVQSRELVEQITVKARALGFDSVNYDLIYGLPKQSPESMRRLAQITVELRPDRIALYSFAKVPWIKPAQRLFSDADVPSGEEKRALYEIAREILENAGYVEIGMDHFALKTDSMFAAMAEGRLHRNFMGYTARRTDVLLGLGMSSISETPTCFHQNEKHPEKYKELVASGQIPTFRGHQLNSEDRAAREQILKLMTCWETTLEAEQKPEVLALLRPMIEDSLVEITGNTLRVTGLGKAFLRNACMALDRRLHRKAPETRIFSQSL